MARLNREWIVQRHGLLTELEPGLLTVTGEIRMPFGRFPRRMTVVATRNDHTIIFSPVPLDEPSMARVEALGEPAFIVVPNGYHRLDAGPWKTRYPKARVICPPGARDRVAEAAPVDATTDILRDKAVRFILAEGTGEAESALIVRRGRAATLIVNDLLANVRHPPGLGAWLMARLFGFGVRRPQMPREVRYLFLKDKAALAAQFREWAAIEGLRRIIPSHGEIIDNPVPVLRRLADELG